MPKKTQKPIVEAPPPANSSSSSSAVSSSSDDSAAVSSSSNEDQNSPSTPPPPPVPSSSKKPTTTKRTSPPSSDDDTSDDDDLSPPAKTKPINSTPKPVVNSNSKPRSKPTVAALPSSGKRPLEPDNTKPTSEKKPRKDKSTPGPTETGPVQAAPTTTPQKQLFQRVWSEDDEIVILQGMIEYKAKKKVDPLTNVDDFHDFIKKSLHVGDVNNGQIVNKVRRLKKKFQNAQKKKLTNPHEIRAFQLSKQIWGTPGETVSNHHVDSNNKNSNVGVSGKKDLNSKPGDAGKKKEKGGSDNGQLSKEEDEGRGWVMGRCEEGTVRFEGAEFGFLGGNEVILKEAMRRMDEGEKEEVTRKVNKANSAFLEAYLMRLKVMEVAARKILDELRGDDED